MPSSFEALISSIPEHVKQGVIVLYVQFQLCKNQHGLAQLSKLSQKSHQAQEVRLVNLRNYCKCIIVNYFLEATSYVCVQ